MATVGKGCVNGPGAGPSNTGTTDVRSARNSGATRDKTHDETIMNKLIQKRAALLALALIAGVLIAACGGTTTASDAGGSGLSATGLSASSLVVDGIGADAVKVAATDPVAGLSGRSVPPESLPDGESRLYVKFEGADSPRVPIRNGGLVHLAGGLDAEVFVDPYPTDNLTAWIDLYLELDGKPVSDAHTVILYDMWSMGHGPYVGKSDAATDGHYVFRLDYIMFGAWEQVLEVRMPGSDEVERLTVIVVAVP